MFGLRSARSRAIVAGLALTVLLTVFTALTVWRTQEQNHQLSELEHSSIAATALEHARAQLYLETSLLSGLAFSQDQSLVDEYRQAQLALEEDLSLARAEAEAAGAADQLAILDDLAARKDQFDAMVNLAIPRLLEMDAPEAAQMVGSYLPTMWDTVDAIFADIDRLAESERQDFASDRAAASEDLDLDLWLIVIRTAVAFVITAGVATVLMLSVLRPLASLRLSARAIASGNLRARAKVSGPEEVASLARDFNQMTDALAARTEEYITTTNLTGDIIAKLDAQGRWAFLNDAACQFFGKPRERLLGRPAIEFVHPEDAEETAQAVDEAGVRKEPVRGFVNRMITHAGTRAVEWNAHPLFDQEGQYAGIQLTGRDITERKRAEEALRQAEQRYRELFEEAPAMYVVCRNQDGVPIVADCNGLFVTTLGYVRDEVVGRPVADFYTLESRAQLLEGGGFQRALAGQFVAEERQLVTKDGRIVETVLHAVPEFGPDGRAVGTRAMYVDITERKQMEEALRESEARYRLLAENTSDLIWVVGLDLKYTYMSPAITRMRGYTVDEIVGASIKDTMTPASLELARKTLAEELAIERAGGADPNRSTKLDLEMYCKDGSTIWTEMNMTFLRDPDGRPTGILGVTRDITERKRVEAALRESEERYRLIAENSTDVIWSTDLNFRYTYVSPSVTRLRGYSVEEVMASSFKETLPPGSLDIARKMLAEALAENSRRAAEPFEARTVELELNRKDGSTVWAEIQVTFLRDSDGKPVGIMGVTRDISERKRAEAALRESEEKYRRLVEDSVDGIVIVEGSEIRFANPAALEMLGCQSQEEIVGRPFTEFVSPEHREMMLERGYARQRGEEPPMRYEFKALRADGSAFDAELSVSRITYQGKAAVQGVVRDISERKWAEEALEESEKRYRLIAENATDLVWTMDMNLRHTYVSPSVTRMRGYSVEEAMAQTPEQELTPASLAVAMKVLAEELAIERSEEKDLSRSRTLELEHVCKDGSTVWLEVKMTFLRDSDGRPISILGASRDVTERKRAEEERERLLAELEARAITDSLTGLYNHAYFYQRLADEVDRSKRYGHRFALVMMDLDAFKHYNDSRGHQAGDEALRLVGECIRSAMRRSDMAFRYGGDEFVAILLNADASKAEAIVRRINRRIGTRLNEMGDSAGAWLGVSAGIACFPDDATTVGELVRMADAAMYDAKRLAWARGVMGQGQAVTSVAAPVEALHETQTRRLSGAASSLAAALQDLTAPEVLKKADLRTIAALGAAAEIKDPYIRGHQERTSRLAAALAKEMGLSPDRVRNLRTAGLLHDLGKVSVGERVLNKPGKLTESEFAQIKEHPALGATMIVSGAEALRPLAPIVRHHHERFDGSGYPDGLARENIPLEARILSVVDAFDAMTHERAYRKALSREEALGEIERGAGTRFDRAVVEAFLTAVRRRAEELW